MALGAGDDGWSDAGMERLMKSVGGGACKIHPSSYLVL